MILILLVNEMHENGLFRCRLFTRRINSADFDRFRGQPADLSLQANRLHENAPISVFLFA